MCAHAIHDYAERPSEAIATSSALCSPAMETDERSSTWSLELSVPTVTTTWFGETDARARLARDALEIVRRFLQAYHAG